MHPDEFAALTRLVIAKDGLKAYLPTVCLPRQRHFMVIEDVPTDIDHERAVLDWCLSHVADEDFLVAFAVNDSLFKIVARSAGVIEESVYSAAQDQADRS